MQKETRPSIKGRFLFSYCLLYQKLPKNQNQSKKSPSSVTQLKTKILRVYCLCYGNCFATETTYCKKGGEHC